MPFAGKETPIGEVGQSKGRFGNVPHWSRTQQRLLNMSSNCNVLYFSLDTFVFIKDSETKKWTIFFFFFESLVLELRGQKLELELLQIAQLV